MRRPCSSRARTCGSWDWIAIGTHWPQRSARLAEFGSRAEAHHARFDQLATVVAAAGAASQPIVGVLFDLGVSSPQFDEADRGFSYRYDAPLDMRMDQTSGQSAADLLNTADEHDLAAILRRNADERFAARIAKAIVKARPLHTTTELATVVVDAIPAPARRKGGHPAKRTFQAIRIHVNEELSVLPPALDAALEVLAPGGRLVVISYHSGEDRIVKERLRRADDGGCTCPPGLPCGCGAVPEARLLKRGGWTPSAAEIATNPRAASARLRAVEKLPTEPSRTCHDEPRTRPTPPPRAARLHPPPAPAPRTHLRVVPPPSRRHLRRRRTGAVLAVAAVLVFGSLMSAALFHGLLVGGQSNLDRLDTQLQDERAALARDKLELAKLQSPAHIAAQAEALGMVPADGQTWVSPGTGARPRGHRVRHRHVHRLHHRDHGAVRRIHERVGHGRRGSEHPVNDDDFFGRPRTNRHRHHRPASGLAAGVGAPGTPSQPEVVARTRRSRTHPPSRASGASPGRPSRHRTSPGAVRPAPPPVRSAPSVRPVRRRRRSRAASCAPAPCAASSPSWW